MKLTLKIKLLPTKEQTESLLDTIKKANTICNTISEIAWENKVFNQFRLHHLCYHKLKSCSNLSAQMLVRAISKVADAYKINKKIKRHFKLFGSIAYDSRILSYKSNNAISIWSINGRLKIPFICHNQKYFPYIKGEAALIYKKGKFFLFQVVDVPDVEIDDVEEFIGVDFGIINIATTSDGINHSAKWMNQYREKQQKIRSSIQRKGTRNARKLLKRISGRERTTAIIINHTISKSIVQSAKNQGKGISIENLTNIKFRFKYRHKPFRKKFGNWSYYQLRQFLEYKSGLRGIPLVVVNPAYTSQICNKCKHIGKRTNKVFKCTNPNCKVDILDADINASYNIALLGAVINQPEKSNTFSCSIPIQV